MRVDAFACITLFAVWEFIFRHRRNIVCAAVLRWWWFLEHCETHLLDLHTVRVLVHGAWFKTATTRVRNADRVLLCMVRQHRTHHKPYESVHFIGVAKMQIQL